MKPEKVESEWRVQPPVYKCGGEIKFKYSEVFIEKEFDFDAEEWVNRLDRQEEINEVKKLDPLLNHQKSRKKILAHFLPVIPLINDILGRNREVSIVDFGGGMGEHYQMTYWYPEEARKRIGYYVIEVPRNCIEGEKIGLLGKIQYIPNKLNESGKCTYDGLLFKNQCDIVVLCGVLQYFRGWESLLEKLSTHSPKYFYITRTLLTNLKTFYVCQSTYMKNGWVGEEKHMGDNVTIVFNLQDLIFAMKSLKYELALDLFLTPEPLKMEGYSGEYDRAEYHNLIFRREVE